MAQQPPCSLLYAAPAPFSALRDVASPVERGMAWGSEAAGDITVERRAEWGAGDCVDGWAVRQVEEMQRTGEDAESGGSSGRGDSRGLMTGLQDGGRSSPWRSTGGRSVADDPLKVIAIVFPQVSEASTTLARPSMCCGAQGLFRLTG